MAQASPSSGNKPTRQRKIALALHGGAGMLQRGPQAASAEIPYRAVMQTALDHGWALLEQGACASDCVAEVIKLLEEAPLFNAGRGSVLTADGRVEMDAAIMCGKTLRAGAVAAVEGVRHPIELAYRILLDGRFVLLSGSGARAFAEQVGVDFADPDWFITQQRIHELAAAQSAGKITLDHEKFGTVGAVALDSEGNLAAGTSTGGLTNKTFGRVGDSPLIGCGTYADNATCAVSCTGYGEHFIRHVVAHDLASRMRYGKASLREAADAIIHQKLAPAKALGGLIAIDRKGTIALPFNTNALFRAARDPRGKTTVAIFEA
jgi:beta-aspartyl-peptidase (threonine type)